MKLEIGSKYFIPWSFPMGGKAMWEVVSIDKGRVLSKVVGGEKHMTFYIPDTNFCKFALPESEYQDYLRVIGESEW